MLGKYIICCIAFIVCLSCVGVIFGLLYKPCKHEYELVVKTKALPREISGEGISQEFAKKCAFGLTSVLLKCKKCNKLVKKEMLGLQEDI